MISLKTVNEIEGMVRSYVRQWVITLDHGAS